MPYKENLKKASALKKELDKFRPLTPEAENRIMQKFRLDWNYHSSHIEGNTLTYGETKALILFGHTAQAKPLKDALEMSGHDEAIKNVEDIIRQKRLLTESFIRELHQVILKKPYRVEALTSDGKPTKKLIKIGQYKTAPNHARTVTGEIFYSATPEETPAKMRDLMIWYNENKNPNLNPILFATEFHYRFIRIHPFDDGNGRIARLLMNFILMQNGYPPAIIKAEDKNNYFAALQQADAGQTEYFFDYICKQVIHSLEIMIKGAKGEEIEDQDDLDKKIALLKQEIEAEDEENEIKKLLSVGVVKEIMDKWGYELLENVAKAAIQFNEFYLEPRHLLIINLPNYHHPKRFTDSFPIGQIKTIINDVKDGQIDAAEINMNLIYGVFKKGVKNPQGCNYIFSIRFDKLKYEILIPVFKAESTTQSQISYIKEYLHKPPGREDLTKISKLIKETLYQHLDNIQKKNKEQKN